VLLLGVARWGASAKKPLGNDVVWMEEGATLISALPNPTPKEESFTAPPPMEEPSPAEAEEEEQPNISAATNDIPLATPSSTPKPTPAITPHPKSSPKASPKPTPKKSKATTIASKKTSDKKSKSEAAPKESTASVPSSGVGVPGGRASGTGSAAQFSAYGRMLHDRFFNEWDQPTSVVASGVKMSVLVRLRIEKDGRVSDFALVRPSGNVVVDESVAAVANRVIKVDPLPEGLGKGGHYEVNINFELNAD
jgi:TonB family protein